MGESREPTGQSVAGRCRRTPRVDANQRELRSVLSLLLPAGGEADADAAEVTDRLTLHLGAASPV